MLERITYTVSLVTLSTLEWWQYSFSFQTNCVSFFNCVACDAINVSNVRETNFVAFASYFHMSAWKICTLVSALSFGFTHTHARTSLSPCLSGSQNDTGSLFNHCTLVWQLAVYYALAMYSDAPIRKLSIVYAYKMHQHTIRVTQTHAFQMR